MANTTSDLLKLTLTTLHGGLAEDWARVSKKKNAEGLEVREFKNKQTGVSLPHITKPAPEGTSIETDPVKNAAADKAIAIIMGDEEGDDSDDSDYFVPKTLVAEAGKALANRYCFALSTEEGEIQAMITPIRFFEEEGHCSDQTGPISDLLPRCGESMESTWEFYDPAVKTPVAAAKYLQKLGFFWNREFQDYIQESLTKKLAAALEPSAPSDNTAAPKKTGNNGPKI